MLCYHNVTPAHFFAPFDPGIARLAWLGRQELATLVGRVDLAVGVSDYNRAELDDARVRARPACCRCSSITDAPDQRAAPCRPLERMLQDGLVNILFVGRIAPNKKIEDHIRLAEHFKRYVDATTASSSSGAYDAVPRYYDAIRGADRRVPDAARALLVHRRRCPTPNWRRTTGTRTRTSR